MTGRSQRDGTQLIEEYRKQGLNVQPALNAVEAGLYACERMMFSGKLKAFTSLSNWYQELRMYRRDQEGRVVKECDHAMDAMRYLVMAGMTALERRPTPPVPVYVYYDPAAKPLRWMQ